MIGQVRVVRSAASRLNYDRAEESALSNEAGVGKVAKGGTSLGLRSLEFVGNYKTKGSWRYPEGSLGLGIRGGHNESALRRSKFSSWHVASAMTIKDGSCIGSRWVGRSGPTRGDR